MSDQTDEQGYEEQLTEDELLVRMDTANEWSNRAGKLFFEQERDKATPEQATMWRQFTRCFDRLEVLSELTLHIKLIDRFGALPGSEREQILRDWASAPEASPRFRKYSIFTKVRSRTEACNTVREIRAELKEETDLNCRAMRAFGLTEENEFWPGRFDSFKGNEPAKKKRSRAPIEESTDLRKLIAAILVRNGFKLGPAEVAKRIRADDRAIDEQYDQYLDSSGTSKMLFDTLGKDKKLMDNFSKLVSDVKSALKAQKTSV